MPNKRLYYAVALAFLLAAFAMQILHVPMAETALIAAFIFGRWVQTRHALYLEKVLAVEQGKLHTNGWYQASMAAIMGALLLKLFHVPFTEHLLWLAFVFGFWVQSRYIQKREAQLKESHLALE
ncbi:MAG: hypothetical protein ACO1OQ_05870 [Rufibacter sp.]